MKTNNSLKLSEALRQIIDNDPQLGYFISHRLLNLSQFAKFARPSIEAMTGKFFRESAVIMALSRYQRKVEVTYRPKLRVSRLDLHTDLGTMSFDKEEGVHQEIQKMFNKAMEKKIYFVISESNNEITIITKADFLLEQNPPEPKYDHFNLAAITVEFEKSMLEQPGVVAAVLQRLSLLDINLVEISSTCTELTCYIEREDMKLAFDTLEANFME